MNSLFEFRIGERKKCSENRNLTLLIKWEGHYILSILPKGMARILIRSDLCGIERDVLEQIWIEQY